MMIANPMSSYGSGGGLFVCLSVFSVWVIGMGVSRNDDS